MEQLYYGVSFKEMVLLFLLILFAELSLLGWISYQHGGLANVHTAIIFLSATTTFLLIALVVYFSSYKTMVFGGGIRIMRPFRDNLLVRWNDVLSVDIEKKHVTIKHKKGRVRLSPRELGLGENELLSFVEALRKERARLS